MTLCPCGSQKQYSKCCEPIHKGAVTAKTAEQLMRARYSAYVKANTQFLFDSTHSDHRSDYDHKGTEDWAKSAKWLGLEIISTQDGNESDSTGSVEFIARYIEKGVERQHHEKGSFIKENDKWCFTEGDMVTNRPFARTTPKIGRNDPCSCGSGLKFKKCCGK